VQHLGIPVGLVFASHQVGGALSTYLVGWPFDLTGRDVANMPMSITMSIAGAFARYIMQE
jgi:hypothetical protein